MRHSVRRRSRKGRRAVVASIALMLGGGGLIGVNTYASAGEGWGQGSGDGNEQQQNQTLNAGSASTIKCPEVANGLPAVPDGAKQQVDRELATLDSQITEAYKRFADEKARMVEDPSYAEKTVLGPLEDKRSASIERIVGTISRAAGKSPKGMESMAPCTLQVDGPDKGDGGQNNDQGQGQNDGGQNDGGQNNGDGGGNQDQAPGQAGNGPDQGDFVDIRSVRPNVQEPRKLRNASRGTFTTDCGTNQNGKFNPDNVIVAP
ncbi:hypothetical protein ACFXN3_34230, partial [Streptomyces sp. NPDC059165]